MQIHELNNFTGTLGSGAYLAIDDGNDTGKISSQGLLAATEARIDNIIAGPAPSAEEIVDARLGDDGVTYPSLGDAIRDQFSDVKSELSEVSYSNEENLTDQLIQNYGITTNISVGSTVDIVPVLNTGFKYLIVPCNKYDVFTITIKGGTNFKAWAITDTSYKLLSKSSATTVTDAVLSIEQDGYVILNHTGTGTTPSIKVKRFLANKRIISDTEKAISGRSPKLPTVTTLSPTLNVGIVNYETLEVYSTGDTYTGRYTTISVEKGERYRITGKGLGSGITYYPCAFLVHSGNNGKSLLLPDAQYYTDADVVIPADGTLYVNGVIDAGVLKLYVKSVVNPTDSNYIKMLDMIPKHAKYKVLYDNNVKIKWKHGNYDIMLVLDRVGGNSLFNFKKLYKMSNASEYINDDFSEDSDDIVSSWNMTVSDWIGPYVVSADSNGDGDNPTSGYFTGGYHRTTNSSSGGGITATEDSFEIFVDGVSPTSGAIYTANSIDILWKNLINGYNTSKADGTGRNIISEEWNMHFDLSGKVKVNNTITALEACKITTYYGLQATIPSGGSVRYKGGVRSLIARGDSSNTGTNDVREAIAYSPDFNAELSVDAVDLGLFAFNAGYSYFTSTSNKLYASLVRSNTLSLNLGDCAYLSGAYKFSLN